MALPAIAIVLLALVTATPSFAQLCRLGEEKWVTACSVELNTGRHGSARTCTGSPPPGFVMVEWKAQTDNVKNGDIALSAIQGQRYDWKEQIEQAYQHLVDDVIKGTYIDDKGEKTDNRLAAKIKEDMQNASAESAAFSPFNQTLRLTANTNSREKFDNRRSWAKGTALMKIKCVAPGDMVDQLAKKYGLTRTAAKPETQQQTQ